jgi:hypothetical protein
MIGPVSPLLLLALCVSPALPAQDAEQAAASKLTGAALPDGAFRLLDKDTIEKTSALLKALYKDVGLVRIEVLLWAGDYTGEKGAALRQQAGKVLEKEGFAWKEALSDQKIEGREVVLSSATRPKRRCLGLWLSSAEGAMLAWGEDAAADAPEAVFGNVIYTPPKGWAVQAAADGITLTPPDLLPEEKLFLLILPGLEFKGSLVESAEKLWADACRAFDVTGQPWSSEKVAPRRSFKGWDYFSVGTTVRKAESDLFLSVHFLHVGDRLERVAVLTNWVSQPYRESPAASPRYSGVLHEFVFSLKFKNHPEPVLSQPLLTGDGIVGVWGGISMGVSGLSGRAEWKDYYAAFYRNGLALFTNRLPTDAFERMNPYLQGETSPRWWGTWTFENGRGVLKMPYGEIPLEKKGLDLVLTTNKTPHTYVKMPPVDGARFDGTWTLSEFEGKTPSITFAADGRFTDDGALKVLEHGLYRLYKVAGKPGAGTYEVKNHTVLFHYNDGREFSTVFLGIGFKKEEPRPATLTLSFNHDVLKRR